MDGQLLDIWDEGFRHTRPWYRHGCALLAERLTPAEHRQKYPAWIARQQIRDVLSRSLGRRDHNVWTVNARQLKELVCHIRRVPITDKACHASKQYLYDVLVPLGLLKIQVMTPRTWRVTVVPWQQWWLKVFDKWAGDERDLRAYYYLATRVNIRAWGVLLPRSSKYSSPREWAGHVRDRLIYEPTAAIMNGGTDDSPFGVKPDKRKALKKRRGARVSNEPRAIAEASEQAIDSFAAQWRALAPSRVSWCASNERLADLCGCSVSTFKRGLAGQFTVRRVPQSVTYGNTLKGRQVEQVRQVFRREGQRPPRMHPTRKADGWKMQWDLPNRWQQRKAYVNWEWEPMPQALWKLGGPYVREHNEQPVRQTLFTANAWAGKVLKWEGWTPRCVQVKPGAVELRPLKIPTRARTSLRQLGAIEGGTQQVWALGRVTQHPPRGTHQPPMDKLPHGQKHWNPEMTKLAHREHASTYRNRRAREAAADRLDKLYASVGWY